MSNVSAAADERGLLERATLCCVTTAICCVFLFVNCTMLFVLRTKAVFRDTCRYILLYNLLFSDTVQLVVSQLLYLLATFRVRLSYPVCGVLITLNNVILRTSPVTLVVMSFDRYVAVCYPLQHPTIATLGKTKGAICVIWVISSVKVFSHISLLIDNPFDSLNSLQMEIFCAHDNMLMSPVVALFDKVYELTLFISSGVSISFSYIGVLVAARSASTDKVSASKAHKTLLLHMIQLGLSLASTMFNPVIIFIAQVTDITTMRRIRIMFYVCVVMLPRCVSPLIYGLKDHNIRPVLLHYLFCQLTTFISRQVAH
ncbi:unnamed protein product [Ophioblennius macclurei]